MKAQVPAEGNSRFPGAFPHPWIILRARPASSECAPLVQRLPMGLPMLSAHWEEVKSIFEAALLREEAQRETFVSSCCGEDRELAQEVYRLLAADRESSRFLEGSILPSASVLSLLTEDGLLAKGDVLCQRFRILAYLGEGGMGQVYKAVDLELRQQIAIKAIRREIADAPGVLTRFKREVNATRKVTHPNVCRTFDLETHTPTEEQAVGLRAPITFLTMELLVGETLADRLHRTGPLPPEQVEIYAKQIAQALQAAHSAGVIHCDLKPSNIFLSGTESDPRVVVTDFGIAKLIRPQEQSSTSLLTASGIPGDAAAGTPFYMAPEQIEAGECTPASDLYSFGLVIYEALTAQKISPYRRSHSEIVAALRSLQLQPGPGKEKISAIEPVWVDIIARSVRPDPKDRFESVQRVLDLLANSSRLPSDSQPPQSDFGDTRRNGVRRWRGVTSKWNALSWQVRTFLLSVAILVPLVFISRDRTGASNGGLYPARMSSSVAVLPVIDKGSDSQLDALAERITSSLTNNLALVSGLRVPSQSTVRDLGNAPDVASIRRKLGVDTIVNGSIVNAGGESILQIELVDVRNGLQLWGKSFTRQQIESPTLTEDIAQEIAYRLQTRNDKIPASRRTHRRSGVPAAEAAFVQGQKALVEDTYAGFERAVKFFQEALDADPNYAEAMAELSRSYMHMAINNGRSEPSLALMSQAENTARSALRADATLAAAYTSLAQVEMSRDYNWSGAEENFKRAEELEPDYVPAHVAYALDLTARGRFVEARAQLAYGDSESPKRLGTSLTRALTAYFSRDYEGSIRQIEQIRSQFHTSAVAIEIEALNYLALNSPENALMVLIEAQPDPTAPHELRDALRGVAFAQMGQRRRALAQLKRLEESYKNDDSSYYIAALCARLGDYDKALAYLEKSHQGRQTDMLFLAVDPLMDPLRPDQRFRSLLSTLNLL
jgi:serine/threonine protein kinase/tetratricopeptide (TPR) repeat protein